jgi:outer membrane murein-binding lipoprotein Lpp
MSGPDVLVPMTLFVSIAAVAVLRGPLGSAIAERIRGGGAPDRHLAGEVEQLRADLDAVRQELGEAQERLDFAERLLARPADGGRLPDAG